MRRDFTLQKIYFGTSSIYLSGRDNTLTCFEPSEEILSPEKLGFGIAVTPSSTTEAKNCTQLLEIQLFYFLISPELLMNTSWFWIFPCAYPARFCYNSTVPSTANSLFPRVSQPGLEPGNLQFLPAFLGSLLYPSHQLFYGLVSTSSALSYAGRKTQQ